MNLTKPPCRPMHPNTKPTVVVLILCMVILGVLLLPLPFIAYKILKVILSLGLLYAAAFFLRPCKNLKFITENGARELGTRDPKTGTFTGTLETFHAGEWVAVALDEKNSKIIEFLGCHIPVIICAESMPESMPPISLQMSLGLLTTAVLMNPICNIHLPRTSWMILDVIIIVLLGCAYYFIQEENTGKRPHFPLTRSASQTPKSPFMDLNDLGHYLQRYWPAIFGVAFLLDLYSTQVGGHKFEDINLFNEIAKTMLILFHSALIAFFGYGIISAFLGGIQTLIIEFVLTIFLLSFICLTFNGYMVPSPEDTDEYEPMEYWERMGL